MIDRLIMILLSSPPNWTSFEQVHHIRPQFPKNFYTISWSALNFYFCKMNWSMKSLCSASVFSRLCNCILYLSSWVFFSCINPTSCCCWLSRCFAMLFNRLRAPIAWGGGFIGIKRIKTLFISYQGYLKLFWWASLISETTQGNIPISIYMTNFNGRRGQIQSLW